VYEYIVPENQPKLSSLNVSLQLHNLPSDCAGELFKPSKDLASLRICNVKKFFLGFFVGDVLSEVGYWSFWLMLPDLGPNCSTAAFRSSFHGKLV